MDTIFLVEDEPNIRMLTGMHLQLSGYTVRELEDAASARDALRKEKPALALLDIMMLLFAPAAFPAAFRHAGFQRTYPCWRVR